MQLSYWSGLDKPKHLNQPKDFVSQRFKLSNSAVFYIVCNPHQLNFNELAALYCKDSISSVTPRFDLIAVMEKLLKSYLNISNA